MQTRALIIVLLLVAARAQAANWIAPDWAGKEPAFPAESMDFHTNTYSTCPVVFHFTLDVKEPSPKFAVIELRAMDYASVHVNGELAASVSRERGKDEKNAPPQVVALQAEFSKLLEPGQNEILINTGNAGIALEGAVVSNNSASRFSTDSNGWRAMKFPPLTVFEDEFSRARFADDGKNKRGRPIDPWVSRAAVDKWFAVKKADGKDPLVVSDEALANAAKALILEFITKKDEEARWRLTMLAEHGIAIHDWEACGFGGAGRVPDKVAAAREALSEQSPVKRMVRANVICAKAVLDDELWSLHRQAEAFVELPQSDRKLDALRLLIEKVENDHADAMKDERSSSTSPRLAECLIGIGVLRRDFKLNPANRSLDNKFGWIDSTALLDSDPARWGLKTSDGVARYSSPLSPASLLTLSGDKITFDGFDKAPPVKVYKKPALVGPIGAWAVIDGKLRSLRPDANGVVYDAEKTGKLTENWFALIHDMARGGALPTQFVFLDAPTRIEFTGANTEKGTSAVTVQFKNAGGAGAGGARLFVLRPLKEWRGYLREAQTLSDEPSKGGANRYIDQFRLWSRALLKYPTGYSEAFVRDPADKHALLVADTYAYRDFTDAWNTQPLQLAPLPTLACYGLMTEYPGLRVIGETKTLGSWGIWGDHVAAVDKNRILYRVPLDPIKRFGGFTSYCFGGSDVGVPGNINELKAVQMTGSNSYRPQHNFDNDAALKLARWCVERNLQNVFNLDEKWVPDAAEHFRKLAEGCKDFPEDLIAYDLLNEPETRQPREYNAFMRKISAAIRAVDSKHLIYIESMPPWGPGAAPFPKGAFESLEPTGDPRTVYSFHDYEYRLPPRWPNDKNSISDLATRWIPAFRFAIDHRCALHLGEFGGFEQTKENIYENKCALTLMADYFSIFDQFGWHFHYYANRGTTRVRRDGSLQESCVQMAYRRYFEKGTFNLNRE